MTPLDSTFVVANLKNLRQPTVNLDSVYGDGPTFDASNPTQATDFYNGIEFKIGTAAIKDLAGNDIGGEHPA